MPDWISQALARIDIEQLVAMALILWFGYNRLIKKMDKIESELGKVKEKVSDLDKNVYGLNISMRSKECCILHHSEQRKAE